MGNGQGNISPVVPGPGEDTGVFVVTAVVLESGFQVDLVSQTDLRTRLIGNAFTIQTLIKAVCVRINAPIAAGEYNVAARLHNRGHAPGPGTESIGVIQHREFRG